MKINKQFYIAVCFVLYSFLPLCAPVHADDTDVLAQQSSYDSRKYNIITPAVDQGTSSLCWAYAAISASEASILKSGIAPEETNKTLRLSPRQLGYARHNRGADPLENTKGETTGEDWYYASGNSSYAPAVFSQWCGPVGGDMPENCDGWKNTRFLLHNCISFDGKDLKTDPQSRLALKKAIVKYGAVTFSYNNRRETPYYNPSNETGGGSSPHACTIIGWDDTIPATSFIPGGATQDGGWLVKNSYSSLPYFYLSYDNASSNIYAFSFVETDQYDYNYFYDAEAADFGLGSLIRPNQAANIFETKKGSTMEPELISAVNAGVDGKNIVLTVKIYQNLQNAADPISGTLAAQETITLENAGYYTVELSEPIPVEKGSLFSVVAEIVSGENAHFKITQDQGNSFLCRNNAWQQIPYAPRLKVYTKLSYEKIYFADGKVFIKTTEDEKGIFLLAFYDKNRLQDLRIFPAGDLKTYCYPIPKEWDKGDSAIVKGFLWESLDSMKPFFCREVLWK